MRVATRRVPGTIIVFLVLGLGFSGVAGFVEAEPQTVAVPAPQSGDTAFYHIKDVIDDPDAVIGPMRWDWASLTLGLPETLADPSGAPQTVLPLRFHTMYAQGETYEVERLRETFFTSTGPLAERWHQDASWSTQGGVQAVPVDGPWSDATTFGEMPAGEADVHYTLYTGPMGLCGAWAPIHGAAEAPATMEVPGYCRHPRLMGEETTTMYRMVAYTTWNDREAVVYQPVNGPAWNLTYAQGVPFPVEIEVSLAETVYAPWQVGRHFRFEMQGFVRGTGEGLAPPVEPLQPLPSVPRVPDVHVDESGITTQRLTLAEAYALAMADTAQPRLADYMARDGAYLGAAWRGQYVDSDGRITTAWAIVATTGDSMLSKIVYDEPAGYVLVLDPGYQQRVDDYPYQLGTIRFPPKATLPTHVTSLSAALERQQAFHPANEAPDTWGFYHECLNEACTQTRFEVRVGQERLPHTGMSMETQGRPAPYQRNVFFGQEGHAAHVWSYEGSGGSTGLLPPAARISTTPEAPKSAAQPVWNAPSAGAAASAGFIAILGGLLYYFWPALKTGAVGLFSRIDRSQVLDHPARQKVMDAIEAEPGIHFQELVRRSGFGRGTTEHHLQRLLDHGMVSETRASGYTCYFARGAVDRRVMAALPVVKASAARRLLTAIATQPGMPGRHFATTLQLAPSTVSYHTQRMVQAGLIDPSSGLRATDVGQAALEHLR